MFKLVESLCCTPKANKTLCVSYAQIKKYIFFSKNLF